MADTIDAVISIDEDSRVLFWNAAAERIFGISQEEAMGSDIATLIIPEPFRKLHHAGMRRLKETGIGPLLNDTVEVSALRKSGARRFASS